MLRLGAVVEVQDAVPLRRGLWLVLPNSIHVVHEVLKMDDGRSELQVECLGERVVLGNDDFDLLVRVHKLE